MLVLVSKSEKEKRWSDEGEVFRRGEKKKRDERTPLARRRKKGKERSSLGET